MFERSFLLHAASMLALAATTTAHADLLVGDFSGSDASAANPVLRFADGASGDVAPRSSFFTDLPGNRLQTPFYLTYEPVEHVLYVADFYAQAIRVYADNARGNMVPLRSMTSPSLGQPRHVAVSVEHDEMFAAVSGCCLAAFPRTASGNTAALRFIQWGGSSGSVTRLNNPGGPVLRNASDTLIVADYKQNPDNSYSGVLLSFARDANGNTAPVSALEGNLTMLGTSAIGPAYDESHDELFVVAFDSTTSAYRLLAFAGGAGGNTSPLRRVEGSATLLGGVSTISYDPYHDTIYVSQGGFNGYAANVLAFARTADGNVAPVRVLGGASTTIGYPFGIAATDGPVFRDGFE